MTHCALRQVGVVSTASKTEPAPHREGRQGEPAAAGGCGFQTPGKEDEPREGRQRSGGSLN